LGANGNRYQEECHRGHRLVEPNTKPGTGGGRRCRACERALSTAHNNFVRHGIPTSKEELDALADAKYAELRA
jgi:hypothetical protein